MMEKSPGESTGWEYDVIILVTNPGREACPFMAKSTHCACFFCKPNPTPQARLAWLPSKAESVYDGHGVLYFCQP